MIDPVLVDELRERALLLLDGALKTAKNPKTKPPLAIEAAELVLRWSAVIEWCDIQLAPEGGSQPARPSQPSAISLQPSAPKFRIVHETMVPIDKEVKEPTEFATMEEAERGIALICATRPAWHGRLVVISI